ncbi:MAG: hypothetical protein U5L96_11450 [Owenweeksia sp.]|nr:hypothetical protein [Owenweeksia sp.]
MYATKTGLPHAFFMTVISFVLVLYFTSYPHHSIGDSSVHSFVDLGLSGQLLLYLLFFTIISFGIFFIRYRHIPKSKKDDELSSPGILDVYR